MPRLVGKQENSGWFTMIVLILILAGAGYLEYIGFINVIPDFGNELTLKD